MLSLDGGFVPSAHPVALGETVQWTFYGPSVHEVADHTGLGLFDSGPQGIVSFFRTTFTAAGVYSYTDPLNPGLVGKISAPVVVTPANGTATTSFRITWASTPPAPGRVFDVQIRRPGATNYTDWVTGTTATSSSFTPDAGRGTYLFRSRLRDAATGAKSGFSAGKAVTVS